MTQLTINFENKALIPIFKKLIKEMNGVSIAKTPVKSKKNILEEYKGTPEYEIAMGIKRGMEEVKLIQEGKLKGKSIREVLNEL